MKMNIEEERFKYQTDYLKKNQEFVFGNCKNYEIISWITFHKSKE
jgi:hypothetical protein